MITKIVIVAENNVPMSKLGDNPEAKVQVAWNGLLNLIPFAEGETAYVESVQVYDTPVFN